MKNVGKDKAIADSQTTQARVVITLRIRDALHGDQLICWLFGNDFAEKTE
jgi:hypothetical protein